MGQGIYGLVCRQKNDLTKDIHILVLRTYAYVRFHGKMQQWRLQMKLRLLVRSLSKREIILNDACGCSISTRILESRRGRETEEPERSELKDSDRCCWLWDGGMGTWTRECRWLLEARKKQADSFLESPGKIQPRWDADFSSVRFILDFGSPVLSHNKFMLF